MVLAEINTSALWKKNNERDDDFCMSFSALL